MAHFLYLVRHGEQLDAEHGLPDGPLSPRGVRQVHAIADRLGGVPFTGAWFSPADGAESTAQILSQRLPGVHPEPSVLLLDCVPSGPEPGLPDAFLPYFGGIADEVIDAGTAQMSDAVQEWLRPTVEDTHDLLITHNFVIAWFVREVFDAPAWRWLTVNQANCGLTIIRAQAVKPHTLIAHNDLGHLPVELRTGLPVPQPI